MDMFAAFIERVGKKVVRAIAGIIILIVFAIVIYDIVTPYIKASN